MHGANEVLLDVELLWAAEVRRRTATASRCSQQIRSRFHEWTDRSAYRRHLAGL